MPRYVIRAGTARRVDDTRDEITAAAGDEPDRPLPAGWTGIIALEDTITGDDRMFVADSLDWSAEGLFPLPLDWAPVRSEGHDGAVTVGTIDRVWRDGQQIHGEGRFDLGSEEGREIARRVDDGQAVSPSVDIDFVDVEIQVLRSLLDDGAALADGIVVEESAAPADGEEPAPTPDGEDREVVARFRPGEELMVVRSSLLRGATLVPIAAFVGTTIEGVYDDDVDETEPAPALAAAAVVEPPPADWFRSPGFDRPTPLTVDGRRVFGHIAEWGTCHTGFAECVEPPASATSYAYFHTGEVDSSSGPVAVGRITVDTTHANRRLSVADTVAHYEHSGTCVAYVRAGEDAHGIWVAGMINPRASDEQIAELRAHPPSGDWRRIGGSLELVATLAVNSPGFPVPRAMVAGGHVQALQRPARIVAAGAPRGENATDTTIVSWLVGREVERQHRRVTAVKARRIADRVDAVAGGR